MPIITAITPRTAAEKVRDGTSLMIGGFMGVGAPHRMIDALVEHAPTGLTVIANDSGLPGEGIGKLVAAGLVERMIVSHIGLNLETQTKMNSGEIEIELGPARIAYRTYPSRWRGLGRGADFNRNWHAGRRRQAGDRGGWRAFSARNAAQS